MISKTTEFRGLARKHTRTAVATLLGLMTNEKVAPPVRLAASNSLLDRIWGRPAQTIAGDDGKDLRITEIVNTIVDHKVNGGAPMRLGETRDIVQLEAPEEVLDPAASESDESSDAQ